MEQKLTRDHARALFDKHGLTYAVLNKNTVQRLRAIINDKMKKSGCLDGTYRCRQRATVKQTAWGKYAEIRCRAFYFDNREVVSFNTDGFIGFAGWASDKQIQPVLDGFEVWVRELAGCDNRP